MRFDFGHIRAGIDNYESRIMSDLSGNDIKDIMMVYNCLKLDLKAGYLPPSFKLRQLYRMIRIKLHLLFR